MSIEWTTTIVELLLKSGYIARVYIISLAERSSPLECAAGGEINLIGQWTASQM